MLVIQAACRRIMLIRGDTLLQWSSKKLMTLRYSKSDSGHHQMD